MCRLSAAGGTPSTLLASLRDAVARALARSLVTVHAAPGMHTPDTLVVLSAPDCVGAKTHTPAGTADYNAPIGPYVVTRVLITDLADLHEFISNCPFNAYHVRGKTIDPQARTIPYRRTKPKGTEPPTLTDDPHHTIVIDYDSKDPHLAPMSDLHQSALEVRALLPPPLDAATCIAQATSSAGIKPGPRIRLWYFCTNRFTSDQELKHWLGDVPNVDTSIFGAHQPIYIAAPRFIGREDPFPRRFTVLPGLDLILPDGDLSPVPNAHKPPQTPNTSTAQALLTAFQINPQRLTDGNRDNALTSIAGSMRARGLEAPAILAALREHNATHVQPPLPEHDLERIASSVATYEPSAVPILIPRDNIRAAKDSKAQCKRVSEDPALLDQALAVLKPHVVSGALTELQVAVRLQEALAKAGVAALQPELVERLRGAAQLADASAPAWQLNLARSADGSIRVDPDNFAIVLEQNPDFRLWYDTRADEAHIERCPWNPSPHALTEADGFSTRRWFASQMGWSKLPVEPFEALRGVARNTPWDPWKDGYLERLVWDGRPRLVHAAQHLLGAGTPREAMCFAWWLLSAVARTYQPGCQVDYLIVLEGMQGVGKSSFLRELVTSPRYYSRVATTGDLNNPRVIGKLQGPVLIELAELSALAKRDVQQTKEFIDNTHDRWQPLYAHTVRESPRQVVFAGTTNEASYLQDSTGNRRFWPIAVTLVNLAALRIHRDQIWAEAVAAYKAGTKWWPTHEQSEQLGMIEAQEARREQELGEDEFQMLISRKLVPHQHGVNQPYVEAWQLHNGKLVRTTAAWVCTALGMPPDKKKAIAKMLRMSGWEKKRARVGADKVPQQVWFAPGHGDDTESTK